MTVAEYNQSVDEYSDGLYRFILKKIRDEEVARDVVQDTYAKLWVKIDDVTASKVKAYLYRAAYHTLIDFIRKEERKVDFNQVDAEDYSHTQQYSDVSEIVNSAIDKLPDVQKSAVLLRDYEGYPYKEIGEIMNITEAQVKVYIYRARMALKEYIGSIEAVL